MPKAFGVRERLGQAIGTAHCEPRGAVHFLRRDGGSSVLAPSACFCTAIRNEELSARPNEASGWPISACSGHGFKHGALGELAAGR